MVIPPFLVVKGSFQGMAGLLNFALIQRPGLAKQNKKGKNTTITSTFCDVLEAECSNPSIGRCQKWKLCNFTTSSFGSSKHTHRNVNIFETIRKLHTQTLFSSN